ncbi:hypothetical protein J7L13_01175 [bacterium]|nr:hypothetical protein [bacterium]
MRIYIFGIKDGKPVYETISHTSEYDLLCKISQLLPIEEDKEETYEEYIIRKLRKGLHPTERKVSKKLQKVLREIGLTKKTDLLRNVQELLEDAIHL